ncbi:MAG: glycosyltransferase family 39 protein [Candidatus Jordarchaeaceae archaeon]
MLHILLSFLIFFLIGLPYSAEFFMKQRNNQKSVLEIVILTSTIGPLIVNFMIFTFGYIGFLSCEILLLVTAIVALAPLSFKSCRSSLKAVYFLIKARLGIVKGLGRLTFDEAFPLSLIASVLIITSFSAFTKAPVLRDPYAVWLFYGKKIMETKTIPLYYGNAPDISWSGNYPPLISFIAGYYFIMLGEAIPEAFTHVSWLYGCLTLLATFLLAREVGLERKCAVLSACLLTTASLFTLELINYGYVTIAWSFYVTASCLYMIRCIEEQTQYSSLLFGLCTGAAMLSTYLSLISVAASLLSIIILHRVSKLRLKRFGIGLIVSFIIIFPWLMRNYILLGNPVYPWFYQILGGKGINPDIVRLVPQPKYPLEDLFIDRTLVAMGNEDLGYTLLIFGLIGSFYLISRKGKKLLLIGLLTLQSFTLFLASMNIYYGYERYLLMVAPLLAVSAGYLLGLILSSEKVFLKILSVIAIAIFSAPNYVYLASMSMHGAPIGETGPLNHIMCYIDNHLPHDAVILTNEIQHYFINRQVVNVYNLPEVFKTENLIYLMALFKNYNITYILINQDIDPEVLGNTLLFRTLNENNANFKVLLEIHPYKLYEVIDDDSS